MCEEKYNERYKVNIDVLTPIHIGSGKILPSSEYIVDTGKFRKNGKIIEKKIVRKIDIIKFFNDSFKSKTEQDVFLNELKDLKFSLNNPEFKSVSNNLKFKDKFKKNNLRKYKNEKYFISWNEEPGPKKDIECAVRSNDKLYIPGSSIKGSIRAALFYNLIELEDIPEIMSYVSEDNFDTPVNNVFSSNALKESSQDNIMRFLQVSDSTVSKKISTIYEVMPITLNTNPKKKPFNESPFAKRYLECIDSGTNLQTELTTNLKEFISDELEFNKKIKKCLDIDFIKKSLFNFADDLINNEVGFCQKYGLRRLEKKYYDLWDENSVKEPLLLLGSTSGFHSKSIYLKINKYDDEYGTHYLKDLESRIDYKNFHFPKKVDFPKTRRFTKVGNLPLGWVKLDFKKL